MTWEVKHEVNDSREQLICNHNIYIILHYLRNCWGLNLSQPHWEQEQSMFPAQQGAKVNEIAQEDR